MSPRSRPDVRDEGAGAVELGRVVSLESRWCVGNNVFESTTNADDDGVTNDRFQKIK